MLRARCLPIAVGAIVLGQTPAARAAPASGDPDRAPVAEIEPEKAPPHLPLRVPGRELREDEDEDDWREPNRLLPAAQVGLMVFGVGAGYWARNHPPRVGLSHMDRFTNTDYLILDASPFRINYLQHAAGGAAFHLAARTFELGLFEAFLYNLAASMAWEYIVEYDRKVDFNDLIFTTPAGFALGEFGYALGRLLQQKPSESGWDSARYTVGLPQELNDSLRGLDGPRGPDVAFRLRLSAGASRAGASTTTPFDSDRSDRRLAQLRLRWLLARKDDLYAPGTRWRGFADGNFTSLDAVLTTGGRGDFGNFFLSDTFIAGWRFADISEERARGRSIRFGSATALRYQSERFGGWRDRVGAAHLPGLAADGAWWGRSWRFETALRLHPDYGGIGALSHRGWSAANPDEVGWTSLADRGYYHALGASGRLRAELVVPYASAGAELFGGRYWNHRGRDLNHEELTIEQRVGSRLGDYDVWLRAVPARPWFLEARLEGRHRWEHYEDLDASARVLRVGLEVGATF
jgi:hypothetical protein